MPWPSVAMAHADRCSRTSTAETPRPNAPSNPATNTLTGTLSQSFCFSAYPTLGFSRRRRVTVAEGTMPGREARRLAAASRCYAVRRPRYALLLDHGSPRPDRAPTVEHRRPIPCPRWHRPPPPKHRRPISCPRRDRPPATTTPQVDSRAGRPSIKPRAVLGVGARMEHT
jgi:hypothetical protein